VIEADYAVDFGTAEIERVCDHSFRLGIDATELGLHRVKDRQQRTLKVRLLGADLSYPLSLGHDAGGTPARSQSATG
jgi:hypothetical protein